MSEKVTLQLKILVEAFHIASIHGGGKQKGFRPQFKRGECWSRPAVFWEFYSDMWCKTTERCFSKFSFDSRDRSGGFYNVAANQKLILARNHSVLCKPAEDFELYV